MLCILAGLAVLLIRREISARSAGPSALAQAGHESAAVSQTHGSGRAVYVGHKANPLTYKGAVRAQWLDDARFWYRDVDSSGAC